MRCFVSLPGILAALTIASLMIGASSAEKVTFDEDRFSLDIPADWKKSKGPEDGNILHREAPGGNGTFAVYKLKVAKGHRANLQGTLKGRVEAIAKSGLTVTGDVKGQEQDFDGKKAVFAVIPVQAKFGDQNVKFRYYLVLIDARDAVVIMQAALPSPLPEEIRESTLRIIQSFREKE